MKASKLLILWMFLATSIWAQETANYVANWHFGQQSAIDFTSGSPVNVSSQIIGNEAMTSVSDGNGSLLFYSSADSTIWDASDQIMPNSYGLTSDQSASCGMVACRVPGTCDQYYIFYKVPKRRSDLDLILNSQEEKMYVLMLQSLVLTMKR